jgi:hypothetical protein
MGDRIILVSGWPISKKKSSPQVLYKSSHFILIGQKSMTASGNSGF